MSLRCALPLLTSLLLSSALAVPGLPQSPLLPDLTVRQRQALERQGFVIAPAWYAQFSDVYGRTQFQGQPAFVTTDAMLHTSHLVFAKLLRDLERETFLPALTSLTGLLVQDGLKQLRALKGTPLEADARRAVAYLAVAQALVQPSARPPAEVAGLVAAELRLIGTHRGFAISPVFQDTARADVDRLREDYSQYVPRGHYAASGALERYFRAMMWLGRITLRASNPAETRTAALLTGLLTGNPEARRLWTRLYDPTTVLIGASDDLTFRDYAAALQRVTGGEVRRLADPAVVKRLQQTLEALPAPRVNSLWVTDVEDRAQATRGLRLMGQRFTLDAAAFGELVYDRVGTRLAPRTLPRGLDLMAALGSDPALTLLKGMGEDRYLNYLPQMAKVRSGFAGLKPEDWTRNVYSGWLYALGALARPEARDARYPAFMRTPAWTRKELLTALGSWTELRHDTLLYVKQTYTTYAVSGPIEPPEPPWGYVEPNLTLWKRLLDLEALTRKVLDEQKILSATTRRNLDELRGTLTFLETASRQQLAGRPLTPQDYRRIEAFGGWLEQMRVRSSDPADPDKPAGGKMEQSAAVVADVATDPNTDRVLEEGTGLIHELYAVVPDGRGGQQLARGGVYSQYEFTVPLSGRLTDEAWRERVSRNEIPPPHPWLGDIVVR